MEGDVTKESWKLEYNGIRKNIEGEVTRKKTGIWKISDKKAMTVNERKLESGRQR